MPQADRSADPAFNSPGRQNTITKISGEELIYGNSDLDGIIKSSPNGPYIEFYASMFDLSGKRQGEYRGILVPNGEGLNTEHLLAEPPVPELPITSPLKVPDLKPYGREKLEFEIAGRGKLLVPGAGYGRLVARSKNEVVMMVEFSGEIAQGTGSFADARGIIAGVGFAEVDPNSSLKEGTRLSFKVFHSIRLLLKGESTRIHSDTRHDFHRRRETRAPSTDQSGYDFEAANENLRNITNYLMFSTTDPHTGPPPQPKFGLLADQPIYSFSFSPERLESRYGNKIGRLRMQFRNLPSENTSNPHDRAAPSKNILSFNKSGYQRFVVENFQLMLNCKDSSIQAVGYGIAEADDVVPNQFRFAAILDVKNSSGVLVNPGIITLNGVVDPSTNVSFFINIRQVEMPPFGIADGCDMRRDHLALKGRVTHPSLFTCSSRSIAGEKFVSETHSSSSLDPTAEAETLVRLVSTFFGPNHTGPCSTSLKETGQIAGSTAGHIIFDPYSKSYPIPLTSTDTTWSFKAPGVETSRLLANIVEGFAFPTKMIGPPTKGTFFRIGAISPIQGLSGGLSGAKGIVTSNFFLNYEAGAWSSFYVFLFSNLDNRPLRSLHQVVSALRQEHSGK